MWGWWGGTNCSPKASERVDETKPPDAICASLALALAQTLAQTLALALALALAQTLNADAERWH